MQINIFRRVGQGISFNVDFTQVLVQLGQGQLDRDVYKRQGETYKGIGKEEINIEYLPVLADEKGAIGSSTSDSERAMITDSAKEVLTLIYSFSRNEDLEKALEYGKKYMEQYACLLYTSRCV